MHLHLQDTPAAANQAAADLLAGWLTRPDVRTLMVAAGNTPLDLYRRIAERRLALGHLQVFALDEYLGVPPDEPRNCANLLRESVAHAWSIPPEQFFTVTSVEADAPAGIRAHELRIARAGGLDAIVLGLGQNGHLGFNEPGSDPESSGRLLDLDPMSVEANRRWFGGDYTPARGVTVGLRTILAARHVLLLAYGSHKMAAVKAMVEGPASPTCPASFLQAHPHAEVFLDRAAAADLHTRE